MLRHTCRAGMPVSGSHNPIYERLNSTALPDASQIYWRPRIRPSKTLRPGSLQRLLSHPDAKASY